VAWFDDGVTRVRRQASTEFPRPRRDRVGVAGVAEERVSRQRGRAAFPPARTFAGRHAGFGLRPGGRKRAKKDGDEQEDEQVRWGRSWAASAQMA
jgi:hypothetical protein